MTREYFFGKAKWVGFTDATKDTFSVLRGHFSVDTPSKVTLSALGLGFFKCYINGICVNPDTFLPLSSDYEAGCDPKDEVLTAHRIYVPSFDITDLVRKGDNVIVLHFGGGWYTTRHRVFGMPKGIYRVLVEEADGVREFVSDESCRLGKSFVSEYDLTAFEGHNYADATDFTAPNFDDSAWEAASLVAPLETEYCETDCQPDALMYTLTPKKVGKGAHGTVYDCGENTTGYPTLRINAARGEQISVLFSEDILPNGDLDMTHHHRQKFTVTSDGKGRTVQPEFTWFGFRYFEVIGDAEPLEVKVIYANIPINSSFECDNETLNWIYKTFLHTMLCNLHTGHPSDCPHLERRGYTGDGQVTCHAALSTLGARELYEKWLQDIADTQDTLSGHIQNAAPYIRSGGGPGGYGCAIVEIPYQLYLHYGDTEPLAKYYANMRRYIDYLESHSEFGLVTSDKAGEWCLGDWCGPVILYPDKDITSHNQQVILPAPMVNTYFMVKSLNRLGEIARILGKEEDVAEYEAKADMRKKAIQAAYFNAFDGNFIMNVQGANSYAADLGLGNDKTYSNMVSYYKKLGHYDTGIFATDILTRMLFEHGDAELAVDLLTNNGEQGFEHWRQNGATTLHEYWDSNRSRSHNHQMFGSPVAYFFEYLLGIRQAVGTAGYASLVIEPMAVSKFEHMSGSMMTPNGKVAVKYEQTNGAITFQLEIPPKTKATFKYAEQKFELREGKNVISL